MSQHYKNLRQRTRLLLDEAMSAVRRGFAQDLEDATRPPQLTQLEQRILMSASPMALVAEPVDVQVEGDAAANDSDVVVDSQVAVAEQATDEGQADAAESEVQAAVELVVIDPSADDHEQLVADLTSQTNRNFEILVLDPHRDGIGQITDALGELSGVTAIHLVSHGEDGEILLGTSVLSQKNIARHAAELVTWQHAMTADADLLIYGCDLAASEEGIALTQSLNTLLGADVAASDDDTGHTQFGGDWDLEHAVGEVETSVAFSSDLQANWEGKLATITVDTFADVVNGGDGVTSLREAIINATAGDTIVLGAGTYTLSIAGAGENASATGDLDINKSINIRGAGATETIIDGGRLDRIFEVRTASGDLHLSDVTLTGGDNASGQGGAIGVMAAASNLTLDNVIVQNSTSGEGGGIYNAGTASLTDVLITGNVTTVSGGGIQNDGTATLNRVTISANDTDSGGGIYHSNLATDLSLTNVTISGNTSSSSGGGIYLRANASITNSTITLNTGDSGGGIRRFAGMVDISNSIIANNTGISANANVQGSFVSGGFNLLDDVTGGSGFIGSDNTSGTINLAALADNGSFVQTHALLAGSDAIDAAGPSGTPLLDQQGFVRDSAADIGAFELNATAPAVGSVSEFRVNTETNDTQVTSAASRGSQRAVAVDAAGNYVVVWSSLNQDGQGWGVYAQRFDSSGNAITAEIPVNTTTNDNQLWARVAADAEGNFVVTWSQTTMADAPRDVYFQRFAADGSKLGGHVVANDTTSGEQKNSTIAMQSNGDFIIAWEGNGPGDTDGIHYRRFDSEGVAIDATDQQANSDDLGTEADPDVAINEAGQFVIAWESRGEIYIRNFHADGTAAHSDVEVDNNLSNSHAPSVAIDQTGRSVVVYRSDGAIVLAGAGAGAWGKAHNHDGSTIGSWFEPSDASFTSDNTAPSVAMDDAGNFAVVFHGNDNGDGTGDSVKLRRYDSYFSAIGPATIVNTSVAGDQNQASVALLDANNLVVVWSGVGDQSGEVDGDGGVFARQYHFIPPVLDLDANNSSGATGSNFRANFNDGGGPVSIVDSDATLSDANSTDLQSLTVRITNRKDGSDEILAADTSGTSITANFNSFTGRLTLSGTDTVANYQQVLRTITYDSLTNPASGTLRTITFVANDGTSVSNVATTTMSLNETVNTAPIADAGGPYTINEGEDLVLDASGSADPDTDPLTYRWDLDADGDNDDYTSATPGATIAWNSLPSAIRDNGSYTIAVQVDDGVNTPVVDFVNLTVNNVAPTLSTTGTGTVIAGTAYTLNLSATDPGNDTITGWTINWGDGTIDTVAGNPSSVTHTYTTSQAGFTFNILASATDEDGTHFQNELLVASSKNDRVIRYNADGSFDQQFAIGDGTDYPVDVIIGPDGNMYLSGWNSDDVLRYNPTTGAFIDEFVPAGTAGLDSAAGLAFGADGNLYVASRKSGEVLRFNGTTGAFIDAFVSAGSGGISEPEGLSFGPDGNLYVSDYQDNKVFKYDGTTGAFLTEFVAAGSGGLNFAEDLTFGPDGHLYVADNNSVLRYNGTSGAFIDAFVSSGNGLNFTSGLAFGPDGNLYVGSWGTDNVLRFNGTTGAFIDEYIAAGSGGLDETDYLNFIPEHQVTVAAPPNTAPTADAGGPYAIIEGANLNLDASASSDPETDTLTYTWDLDNDGLFDDATGETPSIAFASLPLAIRDNGTYTIGVRADDGNGNTNDATTTLTVTNVAPTGNADSGAAFTTDEESSFTTGDATANDTDPAGSNDPLTITSVDTAGTVGLVTINGDGKSFDYDPNGQFDSLANGSPTTDTFTYTVNDGDGGTTTSILVTITINGVNDQPTDISISNLNVPENAVAATIGTLSTTDPDSGDTFSYTVSDSRFEVVGSQLKLKSGNSLDFETEPSVSFMVTSTDAGGLQTTKGFTVTVLDTNDTAPAVDGGQTFSISESAADGTSLGTLTATDGDAGTTFSNWTITGGNADGIFALDNTTGALTVIDNSNLDFETTTSYTLNVTVSDGTNTSAVQTVDIIVTDVNDNTPVITVGQSFSVGESASNGTSLGTVAATDADAGTTFSNWTITGGNVDGIFAVNSSTGEITVVDNSNLDFESTTSYSLSLTVSDGTNTSSSQSVAIGVTAANDSAPVITGGQSFNVIESATNGTSLGIVAATDADAGTTFSNWDITAGNTDGIFAVNSATGEITVDDNSNLDFETTTSYTLSLTVSDGTNTSATETVVITVTAANDNAPVITASQSFNISESATNGTLLGTVVATDADAGTTFSSWTVTAGNTDGIFAVNSATGQVTVVDNSNLDFETTTNYTLGLTVSDGTNTSATETVAITVTAANDNSPVFTSPSGLVIPENTPNFVTLTATDADLPAQSISFSIVGGADAGLMVITGSNILKMAPAADFEMPSDADGNNIYEVQIQADDGNGRTTVQFISVTITDANDNTPVIAGGQSFNVSELATNGTSLGTVTATDADAGTIFSNWTITGGNTDGIFAINNSTGEITVVDNSNLDFESTTSYSLSLTVSDGTNTSSSQTVAIGVTDANDSAPVVSAIGDVSTPEDTPVTGVAFTVADNDTPLSSLVVTVTSSNQSIVADANISVSGTGANRDISLSPVANATGAVTITVSVSDGTSTTTTDFVVSVSSVNDGPTITSIPDVVTNEDTLTTSGSFTVADIDNAVGSLTVTATSSQQHLIANSDIAIIGSGSTRNVRFLPVANAFGGPATITVVVSDGVTSAATTFDVIVLPVNDAPVFASTVSHNYDLGSAGSVFVSAPGLLAGVSDAEGDALTIVLLTMPTQGTLVVQPDGSFQYLAGATFTGSDTFRFYVTDGDVDSNSRTVILEVPVTAPAVTGGNNTPQDNGTSASSDTESGTTEQADDSGESSSSESSSTVEPPPSTTSSSNDDDDDVAPPVAVSDEDDIGAYAQLGGIKATDGMYVFTFDTAVDSSTEVADRVTASELKALQQSIRDASGIAAAITDGLDASIRTSTYSYERFAELKGTIEQISGFEENLGSEYKFNDITTSAVTVAGTSIVVGSVITAIRTGMLALGLLSQLPVWTWFDPLLVMDGVSGGDEGDSLQDIVDAQDSAKVADSDDTTT